MITPNLESARSGSAPSRPSIVHVRRGRLHDVPGLVDLYLGLSPEARQGFHPFPFVRPALWVLYPAVVVGGLLLRPFMRRFPRTAVVIVVAKMAGVRGVAGYGTLRGERRAGRDPVVRFGFVVRDGFRGQRIGSALLRQLSEEGVALGFRTGIGAVFRSDERAVRAISRFGFQLRETDQRDPAHPDEPNFETVLDLAAAVDGRRTEPPTSAPVIPVPPARRR